MGAYHPECPDRLTAIGDRLIASGLDAYLEHHVAPPATREQIARVHGSAYIDQVEGASPASGLHYIDPDTALCPHSLGAARHAAHANQAGSGSGGSDAAGIGGAARRAAAVMRRTDFSASRAIALRSARLS